MVEVINKLELNDKKYQTNGAIRDEDYKIKFLLPIKYLMSFRSDSHSMFLMSTIFVKFDIDGVHVPQFKLSYIHNTTHPSRKKFVHLKQIPSQCSLCQPYS